MHTLVNTLKSSHLSVAKSLPSTNRFQICAVYIWCLHFNCALLYPATHAAPCDK